MQGSFRECSDAGWEDFSERKAELEAKSAPLYGKPVVGGALSERVVVEDKGKMGFFTADNHKIADLMAVKHEDCFAKLIPDIKNENIRTVIENIFNTLYFDKNLEVVFQSYHLNPSTGDDKITKAVDDVLGKEDTKKNEAVAEALKHIAKVSSTVFSMEDILKDAGISKEDAGRLNNRNIASSRFAALMGNAELIARSDRMVLDGNIHGSFMEHAQGIDAAHPGQEGMQKAAGVYNFQHPNFLRQVSNLEIIDWVTWQIDRHAGNMFYQVDGNDAVGIQGNDWPIIPEAKTRI